MRLPLCIYRQSKPADACLACSHSERQFTRCVSQLFCMTCAIPHADPKAKPPPVPPGPGTHLKRLLKSLGLNSVGGCGCRSLARRMDAWGAEGCREHEAEILETLRKNYAKATWLETIKAAALALSTGAAAFVNPLDPAPGLLAEALRRATAAAPS